MRLFVAIDLTAELRARLGQLMETLRREIRPARWVRPEGIHLTLRFLGETQDTERARIDRALASEVPGAVPHFEIHVSGLGVFPPSGRPRVVWVGLSDPHGSLRTLQQRVERAVRDSGFPAEERPFAPHLTLARFESGRAVSDVRRALEGSGADELGVLPVSSVCLFRSLLKPGGAEYQKLAEYAL